MNAVDSLKIKNLQFKILQGIEKAIWKKHGTRDYFSTHEQIVINFCDDILRPKAIPELLILANEALNSTS